MEISHTQKLMQKIEQAKGPHFTKAPVNMDLEDTGLLIHILTEKIVKLNTSSTLNRDDHEMALCQLGRFIRLRDRLIDVNDALMGKEGQARFIVICLDDNARFVQASREKVFTDAETAHHYMKTINFGRMPLLVKLEQQLED